MAQKSIILFYSPADFDIDLDVDLDDLGILGAAWISASGDSEWDPVCDISTPPDGIIDLKDFTQFANLWQGL